MKYVVLLCDGMADLKREDLGNGTPMSCAKKPNMDKLAKTAEIGLVKTVVDGIKPGSDVANLSVLGYDPAIYYSGRSPLEAGSIGIDMLPTDVSFRANLVTLSDEAVYEDKTILDYCADDISTEEAAELMKFIAEKLDTDVFHYYSGVSYRHCLIWNNGTLDVGTLTPPHDITGKPIKEYLGFNEKSQPLFEMMKKSYDLLKDHPVNKAREAKGLRPANSLWFWGEGVRKSLMPFTEKYGKTGAMISAVDLLKGIGKFTGMEVINVEGATGYIDTNFSGKADAAIKALKDGNDFVYIHVEAPDECGHRFEVQNKVKAIELIDELILGPVLKAFEGEELKVLICPDHPTPLELKTHTNAPVPYLIWNSVKAEQGVDCFTEEAAENTGRYVEIGHTLMEHFLGE
ncbi:MAG: cofactor-independent phosphoglycerate mutase [Ruminiclostridium sp.]|nr:cofactor-independent phosphoglycerate mutase [Ruminiclostridium sp.]MBQ8841471.1 cofactor-independent phosphoglycerate mutase [Ruminiclostridium sp.]